MSVRRALARVSIPIYSILKLSLKTCGLRDTLRTSCHTFKDIITNEAGLAINQCTRTSEIT